MKWAGSEPRVNLPGAARNRSHPASLQAAAKYARAHVSGDIDCGGDSLKTTQVGAIPGLPAPPILRANIAPIAIQPLPPYNRRTL